jgi:hypothetical protein
VAVRDEQQQRLPGGLEALHVIPLPASRTRTRSDRVTCAASESPPGSMERGRGQVRRILEAAPVDRRTQRSQGAVQEPGRPSVAPWRGSLRDLARNRSERPNGRVREPWAFNNFWRTSWPRASRFAASACT